MWIKCSITYAICDVKPFKEMTKGKTVHLCKCNIARWDCISFIITNEVHNFAKIAVLLLLFYAINLLYRLSYNGIENIIRLSKYVLHNKSWINHTELTSSYLDFYLNSIDFKKRKKTKKNKTSLVKKTSNAFHYTFSDKHLFKFALYDVEDLKQK